MWSAPLLPIVIVLAPSRTWLTAIGGVAKEAGSDSRQASKCEVINDYVLSWSVTPVAPLPAFKVEVVKESTSSRLS